MVISFKEGNKSWLVPAYFLPQTISFIFFEEENKELILVGSYLYWLVPTYILPQSILWLFYLRKEISVGPGFPKAFFAVLGKELPDKFRHFRQKFRHILSEKKNHSEKE